MRLSLISHASTSALRQARFPGDEALDSIGFQKAEALAGVLPSGVKALISTAARTVQTAAALGLAGAMEPLLDDCDYGAWTGLSLLDVQEQDPSGIMAWLQDPAAAPHGGESLLDVRQRVADWMNGLEQYSGHLVAITHPSVVRLVVLHALGADIAGFWHIEVDPLSLTDLRFNRGRWVLRTAGAELTALHPSG